MVCAFTQMCRVPSSLEKYKMNSHLYEYARKMWSSYLKENHWAYDEKWKKKHSITMKKYYKENPQPKKEVVYEERICVCGCNKVFTVDINKQQEYIHGHNANTNISNEKRSDSLKKYISRLSPEELQERRKKSLGSCDQKARGEKIAASKRGKKSTQRELVGKKLALMSDDEFEKYLKDKNYSISIQKRFTTYREHYINDS